MIFFERKPGSETPWSQSLWTYDLRTNMHFTLKVNPLKYEDLAEFIKCYCQGARPKRKPTWSQEAQDGRWRVYSYDELTQRDKCNLDIFWLKDESLKDGANLPEPDFIAAEIAEDLRAALDEFEEILVDLQRSASV